MPLYEYDCPNCGRTFDKLVRGFSDAGEVDCPNCGGTHAKRKLSMPADSARGRSSTSSFSGGAACSSGST
jgi:putative FmdB family regulatory protein